MKNILPLLFSIAWIALACSPEKKSRGVTDPSDYLSNVHLSSESIDIANNRESISFWQNRLEKNSGDFVALEKLASLYSASFKLNGEIQNLSLSDSLFKMVLRNQDPNHAGIYRSLAANCISRHEFWQAKEYARQAVAIGESKSSSLFVLTDVMIELGNVDSARAILQAFTNHNTFPWLIRHVKILDHEGKLDSAIFTMEKALDLVRNNDQLFCWSKSNLADLYGHAGRIEESYRAYLDVLSRNPDYDYARKGIAWIAYSYDGKSADAEKILLDLIRKKPLPEYFLLLSEISGFRDNTELAGKYAEVFIKEAAASKYGNMYNRHLINLLVDKKPGFALQLAERELRVRPTPESYDLLAWVILKNGDGPKARKLARDYVEGQSHEPEVLMHLGEIFAATDQEKAREYLELALESSFELGPVNSRKIELILADL